MHQVAGPPDISILQREFRPQSAMKQPKPSYAPHENFYLIFTFLNDCTPSISVGGMIHASRQEIILIRT